MESTSLAYFLSQLRLLLLVSIPIRSQEDSTPIALNFTPELRNSGIPVPSRASVSMSDPCYGDVAWSFARLL